MPHTALRQPAMPFRLDAARRAQQLAAFNQRAEIGWFGFQGRFNADGATASILLARLAPGLLGGGGTDAVNGGVIAAGFDAACVLAGLGHYDAPVVVTLELSVQYLSLARAQEGLCFEAAVTRSARSFAFVQACLGVPDSGAVFATAQGMVAPARG